mmetsp:Transcript_19068/g.30310  ORF Transcript_19068/g.30310 Transcript_19068/m.30310 type:complete len:350 (-) Transcript_19068:455-1504(-)
MGICASEEEVQMSKKTKAIEREMEKDAKEQAEISKVLLLGTGESGKSTIFKQMQILAGVPFEQHEKENFKVVIRRNIVSSMQEILDHAEDQEMKLGSDLEEYVEIISEADEYLEDGWKPELGVAIEKLWKSEIIRKIFRERGKLQFPDTVASFFNDIKRISSNSFLPKDCDILRARNRTTGIAERNLKIENALFTFVDVGGQRNERKKWIHFFEGITAVMFIAAISEYNQVLYEDEKVSRLDEALNEFEKIANNDTFAESGMILFLNKIDLLREKLPHVPFKGVFGYEGPNELKEVQKYVQKLFISRVKVEKNVYTYFTCGLDTDNIDRVFRACKKFVLTQNLGEIGFY